MVVMVEMVVVVAMVAMVITVVAMVVAVGGFGGYGGADLHSSGFALWFHAAVGNHTIASRWTATVQWCLRGGGCWPFILL